MALKFILNEDDYLLMTSLVNKWILFKRAVLIIDNKYIKKRELFVNELIKYSQFDKFEFNSEFYSTENLSTNKSLFKKYLTHLKQLNISMINDLNKTDKLFWQTFREIKKFKNLNQRSDYEFYHDANLLIKNISVYRASLWNNDLFVKNFDNRVMYTVKYFTCQHQFLNQYVELREFLDWINSDGKIFFNLWISYFSSSRKFQSSTFGLSSLIKGWLYHDNLKSTKWPILKRPTMNINPEMNFKYKLQDIMVGLEHWAYLNSKIENPEPIFFPNNMKPTIDYSTERRRTWMSVWPVKK